MTATGTDHALLMLHRAGQRIKPRHSIHDSVKDVGPHQCHWRVIVCGHDRDVCECSKCGRQEEFACDFDDEYS